MNYCNEHTRNLINKVIKLTYSIRFSVDNLKKSGKSYHFYSRDLEIIKKDASELDSLLIPFLSISFMNSESKNFLINTGKEALESIDIVKAFDKLEEDPK